MKINNKQLMPGHFVRVVWLDIGAEDSLVVEMLDKVSCRVFGLSSKDLRIVTEDQIIQIGAMIEARYSGLQ